MSKARVFLAVELWAVISYVFFWDSVSGKISFHGSYNCAGCCISQGFQFDVVTVMVHHNEVIAAIQLE